MLIGETKDKHGVELEPMCINVETHGQTETDIYSSGSRDVLQYKL